MRPIVVHIIAGILVCTAAVAGWWYVKHVPPTSSIDTIFQNVLVLTTALGAVLTALYALLNNHLAWLAYQGSIQPSALFLVLSEFGQQRNPKTKIVYQNHSKHDVEGMNIDVRVVTKSMSIDLSDLFSREIKLPAGDSRSRQFDTYSELAKKGFDLQNAAQSGEEVRLIVGYSFRHLGRRLNVPAQQTYVWNTTNQAWQIA